MSKKTLSRRTLIKLAGGSLAFIPLIGLSGCGGSSSSSSDSNSVSDNSSDDSDSDVSTDDSTTPDSTLWATGGTAALAAVAYDDPFNSESLDNACSVTQRLTEGPCHASTVEREDISEGRDGLPTRLWFRILDADCNPVEGARVDIWHCDPNGLYSGNDMQAVDFCTDGENEYMNGDFFRGIQTTDSEGKLYFETCFPGWYAGRAIHIHLAITTASGSFITQVAFDKTLTDNITTNAEIYAFRGLPDTSNTTDAIFPSNFSPFLMETEKLSDNSLLAWKTLIINS